MILRDFYEFFISRRFSAHLSLIDDNHLLGIKFKRLIVQLYNPWCEEVTVILNIGLICPNSVNSLCVYFFSTLFYTWC
jgi:hypothetical protein